MDDKEYIQSILPELAKEMPYKWRVQSFSKDKPQATCVAYIDARDLMDRLDAVCVYGWDRDHKEIKGHLYAGVGIWLPSGRIQWRWDCGVESNTDAEKGESSDSFKRAGVNWGVGRFLYDLGIQYEDANEVKKMEGKKPLNWPYVIDKKKQRVRDLTKFINDKLGNKEPEKTPKPKKEEKKKEKPLTFIESCKKAKEVIGETKFFEVLTAYKAQAADQVIEEYRAEFLEDLRKIAKKGA